MVVLDGGTMVTMGSTQYLQPDYLSPLPTTVSDLFAFQIMIINILAHFICTLKMVVQIFFFLLRVKKN